MTTVNEKTRELFPATVRCQGFISLRYASAGELSLSFPPFLDLHFSTCHFSLNSPRLTEAVNTSIVGRWGKSVYPVEQLGGWKRRPLGIEATASVSGVGGRSRSMVWHVLSRGLGYTGMQVSDSIPAPRVA